MRTSTSNLKPAKPSRKPGPDGAGRPREPRVFDSGGLPEHENNREFHRLIVESGLGRDQVFAIFNKPLQKPVSKSAFDSWLSNPEAARFRGMPDFYIEHARKVLKSLR